MAEVAHIRYQKMAYSIPGGRCHITSHCARLASPLAAHMQDAIVQLMHIIGLLICVVAMDLLVP